jgi:hypothetical protein
MIDQAMSKETILAKRKHWRRCHRGCRSSFAHDRFLAGRSAAGNSDNGSKVVAAHNRDSAARWRVISQIGWLPPQLSATGAPVSVQELRPGLLVLRDDTLATGTKSRWIWEALHAPELRDIERLVYIGAPHGHAQMVLAQGVHAWNSKYSTAPRQAIIVLEERYRDKELPYRDIAVKLGASVVYAEHPYSAAQVLISTKTAALLPPGLDVPAVHSGLQQLAVYIRVTYGPFDEFWYACGSGTIARAVSSTGLASRYYGVQVQPSYTKPNIGTATVVPHNQPFDDVVTPELAPPYPSASHYDAKAFQHIINRPNNLRILLWNVL